MRESKGVKPLCNLRTSRLCFLVLLSLSLLPLPPPLRLGFLIATSITTRGQFYCAWSIAGSAMIASGFAFNGWKEGKKGGKLVPDW